MIKTIIGVGKGKGRARAPPLGSYPGNSENIRANLKIFGQTRKGRAFF